MAIAEIRGGAHIDVLNAAELGAELDLRLGPDARGQWWAEQQSAESARERAEVRGIKDMYLPELLTGKAASSAIALGAAHGQVVGPELGYTWFFYRLILFGLNTGDVVNLYRRDDFGGVPLWQFNGANFGYTFGKAQLFLHGGETLNLQNSGTIASTSQITLGGCLVEVPAERAARFLL